MANTFENRQYRNDSEVVLDSFEFKSAGKKYINQNYKDIGLALGIVESDLGSIKRQANQEKKLPDIQGEITLDQINFYREHYGFNAISQSDYENILSQSNEQSVTDGTVIESLEEASALESSPEQVPNINTSNLPESDSNIVGEVSSSDVSQQSANIESEIVVPESSESQDSTESSIDGIVAQLEDSQNSQEAENITSDIINNNPLVENIPQVVQYLTSEQLENNKQLSGWLAGYELAKIAKSQNIDLSLLSREDYVDFAIQNNLMIDDNQLRMSPWQRMCESPEEINQKLKEMRELINPEVEADFDKFSREMQQKAGESDRSIDNEITVRQGTKNKDSWLFFSINEGANIGDEQIFKSYASLKDLNLLTPDQFTNFMKTLRDAGYNGDIKIFQDLMSQGLRLNDQIVMHGASERDAELGLNMANEFFGDNLADTSLGVDQKNHKTGKYNSYSQVLAQKIKESVQGQISNSEQQSQSTNEVNNTSDLELESLQLELSRLVTEAANKLEIEKGKEIDTEYSGLDREEVERLKESAKQAILRYKEFGDSHAPDLRNPTIQDMYRQFEKQAWYEIERLAHKLGANILTLPQEKVIKESHPEDTDFDTREYLESDLGYKFNQDGEITHIQINGNTIELNRPRSVDELLNRPRPVRIIYYNDQYIQYDETNEASISKGSVIEGLNKNTPDFLVGLLDKEYLEPVIVDETQQYNSSPEGIKDPWLEESKGETEFEKIFADSLKNKDEISGNVGTPDPWFNVYQETNSESTDQSEVGETTPQVLLEDLRLAYARAEEAWNRDRKNLDLENEFDKARKAYNIEFEKVLKLQVSEGQEANIHELFKNEVISLREERIAQSQELQGTWEKRLNPLKEKFVNFVIKHKKLMSRVNLGLGIAGGALALTGVGIPLAGGLAATRRAISGILLGVSSGEGVRSLGEDADINLAWGKIKFQAIIPKLVKESLASSEDEFKKVNDDVLKDRLGTLEAYYRLNGGQFTNNDQQKAYEKILIELGHRVRVNTLENYQNAQESSATQTQESSFNQDDLQESVENFSQDNNSNEVVNSNPETFNFGESKYTLELLNTISDKRVQELDKFRTKRNIATVTGIGVGLLVGGVVHALDEVNKPDSIDADTQINPTNLDSEAEIASPRGDLSQATAPPAPELPPAVDGEALSQSEQLAQSSEATRAAAEQAAQQAAEQLAQDVSSLDSGETIWGEVAKQLGENATDNQIQQAVENLLQSEVGQDSIYKLAQGTEGGRALLAQWGIDNANEMATLSKEQLYEISKYLAPGELQGITELSLDNLDPFDTVEPPQVDVSEAMDAPDPSSVEAPTPSVESANEAPESPQTTIFTESLSKALGTNNLTEYQLQEVIHTYVTSEQGSNQLYEYIIKTDEGTGFLDGFGVKNAADFANLSPDELYEIAQIVGVENLDSLPGFELNEIILSRFEDAPDFVELAKGSKPLDVVNRYIASEIGNLPYDSTIGQQVLNNYLDTPAGKDWLYDAVINNPDKLNGNQNIQFVEEYFRQKGIKSGSEINWLDLTQDRRFPTSMFWRETVLTGGKRIPPLSTLLQPSQMIGIKESIRQVLTKQ